MTTSPSILGYRRFLAVRDGEPDVHGDILPRREEFFREIGRHPVRSRRSFERDTFLRNVVRSRPESGLDPHMLWLIATARVNQSERFGIELAKLYGRGPAEDSEPEEVHVALQECYHTRTLVDVVAMFGLPVPMRPPDRVARLLIKLMIFNPLPERFLLPLLGMSEMMGCVLFRVLRDRGVELFADEVDVSERIRLLYDEILADEICHVGLIEARLGHTGRSIMRGLYRRFALFSAATLGPEVIALVGRERMLRELRRPFDQVALASQFPDTAYAFGERAAELRAAAP